MAPTFPLLRLSIDECLAVLRIMGTNHLFTLSLISKRAKTLVASAKRRAEAVVVNVNQKIHFWCRMPQGPRLDVELNIWRTPNAPLKVKKPRFVTILKSSPNDKLIKCKKEEYEVKDWLKHLCEIFHQKDHGLIIQHDGSRYDFDSVYENFKNPANLGLCATENAVYDSRVLKMIIPKSRIALDFLIFENGRPPRYILTQNYESFVCYDNLRLMNWNLPLDDLLCSNAREISTGLPGFSGKDINKFLKLWTLGSNPRLQKLQIFRGEYNYEVLLRGIKNFIVSEDQEKVFKSVTAPFEIVVKGGREIRKMDGTVARIVIGRGFNFFTWID